VAVAMEAAEQLCPVRDGIVRMEELPVAESRSMAFEMIRSWVEWPPGLIGINSLPLVFPPGGPA
jgi:hypothetical protein